MESCYSKIYPKYHGLLSFRNSFFHSDRSYMYNLAASTNLFSIATVTSCSMKKTAESSSNVVPSVSCWSGLREANVSAFTSSSRASERRNLLSVNRYSGWHSYRGEEKISMCTIKSHQCLRICNAKGFRSLS